MDNKEIIASMTVRHISADGNDSSVRFKITKPFEVSEREWSCFVTDPETKRLRRVSGNDGIQVIGIALDYIGRRMVDMQDLGSRWLIKGSDHEFPIDAYFFRDRFLADLERKVRTSQGRERRESAPSKRTP